MFTKASTQNTATQSFRLLIAIGALLLMTACAQDPTKFSEFGYDSLDYGSYNLHSDPTAISQLNN